MIFLTFSLPPSLDGQAGKLASKTLGVLSPEFCLSAAPAKLDGLISDTGDLFPSLSHSVNPFPHLQGHITNYSFVTNYHRLGLTVCIGTVKSRYWLAGCSAEGLIG